ncbi:hypothetical protein GJ496_004191 [Pomphorhynchus laevis]|nr:hypothetical protein GJ496_004191 [Pomphorhynchus laevis]
MGGIRFSTYLKRSPGQRRPYSERLEDIEKELIDTQQRRISLDINHRQFRYKFIKFSSLFSVAFGLLLWITTLFLSTPFDNSSPLSYVLFISIIVLPTMFWLLWKAIRLVYARRILHAEISLEELKKKKNALIEELKSNESYRTAKDLLSRYSCDQEMDFVNDNLAEVRQRRSSRRLSLVDASQHFTEQDNKDQVRSETTSGTDVAFEEKHLTVKLPRTLIAPNRGFFIRLLEWILDDGPNHRYALICSNCICHNGMAFKEEVHRLSYKCAFCGHLNKMSLSTNEKETTD